MPIGEPDYDIVHVFRGLQPHVYHTLAGNSRI